MAETSPNTSLIRDAYAAFNARDIDALLAIMAPDVTWPRAFKGGFVRGYDEIRAYWEEQWTEIDGNVIPLVVHEEDSDRVLVTVHQVVRDLTGVVLSDSQVQHRFIVKGGLIHGMELVDMAG